MRANTQEAYEISDSPSWIVRDRPADEGVLSRLAASGPRALSDRELVALMLKSERVDGALLEAAGELLEGSGGLVGLMEAAASHGRLSGCSSGAWYRLIGACELARRLASAQVPERTPLRRPDDAARYLFLTFASPGQEVMGVVYLDSRNHVLHAEELFRGTLCRAAVEPRVILKRALSRDAASLILFHTHPSGDPAPSLEDLEFTRRMAEGATAVGIRLADHLVLGSSTRWVSLRQRGGW